jgi:hypothetical protein
MSETHETDPVPPKETDGGQYRSETIRGMSERQGLPSEVQDTGVGLDGACPAAVSGYGGAGRDIGPRPDWTIGAGRRPRQPALAVPPGARRRRDRSDGDGGRS